MSANLIKIGVACPLSGERAAFFEWLTKAGYEPVAIASLDAIGQEARAIEALIADVALVPKRDLARLVKTLDPIVRSCSWAARKTASKTCRVMRRG
jgi:hypothetical protein